MIDLKQCTSEAPTPRAYPAINDSRPARIPCCERLLDDGPFFTTKLPSRSYKTEEIRIRKQLRDRKLLSPKCLDLLPLMQRVFHDLSHVKRRDAKQSAQLIERMWSAKTDGPKLHIQIRGGVGFVARLKRGFGSSEGERDHSGDYRVGPILVALRDMLREHAGLIPDVQFVIDLDDKTFESKLPIMAFAALHPAATLRSSSVLIPDWTHMGPSKLREWPGWTFDHSTDKWAGSKAAALLCACSHWSIDLSAVLSRGDIDLSAWQTWQRRDARALWRGFTPVREVGLDGLPLVDMRWSHRLPYVDLQRQYPDEFDVADPVASPHARFLGREEQCGFKHRLFLNGDCCHVSHGGLKWALACGSLAIWVQPIWVLHWYHLLEENTNFLIARTPEDLREKLQYYQAHPHCAHAIAKKGHQLAQKYLSERAVLCYWATLLRSYATKLPFDGQLHANAISIETILWERLRQFADKRP